MSQRGKKPSAQPDGFGALAIFADVSLQPGAECRWEASFDGEILVYVRRGTIRCADSQGASELVRAGVFVRASSKRGDWCSYGNNEPARGAQIVAIGMYSAQSSTDQSREKIRITAARRRSVLCVVASPEARHGALRLAGNAVVFSAILMRGQHVVHELLPGRGVWIQVLEGRLSVGGAAVAAAGDGVAVTNERAVSITALIETEILLFDVDEA